MAPPFGAEVFRSQTGGLFEVMPPKAQRLSTEVMRWAAGGSPISLSGLRRAGAFRLGLSLMHVLPGLPDHNCAQRVRRHLLRSGFSWTWLCNAGFGCEVGSRLSARSRKSSSQPLGAGDHDWAPGRSVKKLSNPGSFESLSHSEQGFLDLKEGSSHPHSGRPAFLDETIAVQPPVPAPKLLG